MMKWLGKERLLVPEARSLRPPDDQARGYKGLLVPQEILNSQLVVDWCLPWRACRQPLVHKLRRLCLADTWLRAGAFVAG